MAYKYGFFDNQTIGVDNLNEIVSRFVTDGVSRTVSSVSDFNAFNAAIATGGVVPESDLSLKVTKTGTTAYIAPGIAYFADGTSIEITSTESLSVTPGVINYIYLKTDNILCKAYPVCSATEPTGTDFVMLARINANGTVTDKRQYARGKSPCTYSSANNSIIFDHVLPTSLETMTSYSIPIGSSDFNVLITQWEDSWIDQNNTEQKCLAISITRFNESGVATSNVSLCHGNYGLSVVDYISHSNAIIAYTNRSTANGDYPRRIIAKFAISNGRLILTPQEGSLVSASTTVRFILAKGGVNAD